MKESDLQVQVADYLRLRYPDVLFHSDFGSGIKLTKGQAIKQKRQNGGRRGWPDMFIAEPRATKRGNRVGLFIELKKDGARLWKKDGTPASDHIEEQARVLSELQMRGYEAKFAVGFEETKQIIDDYLGGEE
jgi:hypothetical protein